MNRTNLPEKWIAGLDAQSSVADAAQSVLVRRVGTVASMLKSLAKADAKGDEHVHQLRVATRRAQAALLSFKPWLRHGRRRTVNKTLRRIRTAAGVVRMGDVHRGMLLAMLPQSHGEDRSAIEAALIMLAHDRNQSIGALHRLTRRPSARRALGQRGDRWFRRTNQRAAGAVASDQANHPSLAASVRKAGDSALRALAAKVIDSSESGLATREQLHDLRLRCKRLRYAIEIFGSTSAHFEILAALTTSLIDIQERLGAVNDAHEIAERMTRYARDLQTLVSDESEHEPAAQSLLAPALQRLSDTFELRCVHLAEAFQRWWQGEDAHDFRAALQRIADVPIPEPAESCSDSTAGTETDVDVVVMPHRNGAAHASPAASTPSNPRSTAANLEEEG